MKDKCCSCGEEKEGINLTDQQDHNDGFYCESCLEKMDIIEYKPATPARFEMPSDICGNMLAITNELRIEIATLKWQNAELKESNRRLREVLNDVEIQNRVNG